MRRSSGTRYSNRRGNLLKGNQVGFPHPLHSVCSCACSLPAVHARGAICGCSGTSLRLLATARSFPPGPPPNAGFFPFSQVRPGMMATAWTVFQGTTPEPMQVEILGVLRGARGPGQDMILAQLRGAKPGIHRRRRRHERQPRLHRQQAPRLALLPHRRIQQRSHRRHHAHRADARGARFPRVPSHRLSTHNPTPSARTHRPAPPPLPRSRLPPAI